MGKKRYIGCFQTQTKRNTTWLWAVLAAVSAVLIAVGLWNIASAQLEYAAGRKSYQQLLQYVSPIQESTEQKIERQPSAVPDGAQSVNPYAGTQFPTVDFEGLRSVNPDVVGWIQISDTHVNYPIVQGADNVYYLNHMLNGEGNGSGCIFMDAVCKGDFSGRHTILYGHNVKNKSMFYDLVEYKEQAFYDNHPAFRLMTPEANYVVEVFSVAPVSVYKDGWRTEFDSDEQYAQWLNECTERSIVDTGVVPTVNDRVLTLSTCTYEFADARLLVCGILYPVPV